MAGGTRKQRLRRKARNGHPTTYSVGKIGYGVAPTPRTDPKPRLQSGRMRDQLATEALERSERGDAFGDSLFAGNRFRGR